MPTNQSILHSIDVQQSLKTVSSEIILNLVCILKISEINRILLNFFGKI